MTFCKQFLNDLCHKSLAPKTYVKYWSEGAQKRLKWTKRFFNSFFISFHNSAKIRIRLFFKTSVDNVLKVSSRMKCLFTAEHLACRLLQNRRCFIKKSKNVGNLVMIYQSKHLWNLRYLLKCSKFHCCSRRNYFKNDCEWHQGLQTRGKWWKHEAAGRPIAFTVYECFGALTKHDARVFEIAAQSRLSNERNQIFTIFFIFCRQVCYYEELYCYGDLSFQIGCHQCYHNTVDNYKIKL